MMKKSKVKRAIIFPLFLCVFGIQLQAQGVAVGQWREHLPYNYCISVTEAGNKIYCATRYAVFYYDKSDNSINRLNRITGLSDIGVSTLNYNSKHKTLIIAYSNTNIDLIVDDRVINISDIKRKPILGIKTINKIFFLDDYAYLSCGFGIVQLDLVKREIKDTWYIGPNGDQINVYDLTVNDTDFFAATASGIYYAERDNPNLANFESWKKLEDTPKPDSTYNAIENFNGRLIVNMPGQVYGTDTLYYYENGQWDKFDTGLNDPKWDITATGNSLLISNAYSLDVFDATLSNKSIVYNYNPGTSEPGAAIIDKDNIIWIADRQSGLVKNPWEWQFEKIIPEGPNTVNVGAMATMGNNLWVATGGKDQSWGNLWIRDGAFSFIDEKWKTYNYANAPALDTVVDLIAVAIDPGNPQHVVFASWARGVVDMNNGQITNIFDHNNSSLQQPYVGFNILRVGGVAFDEARNLWVTNSDAGRPLSVKTVAGEWKSFSLSPHVVEEVMSAVIVDSRNYKWIILPRSNGLAVFNDNNTLFDESDDKVKKLTANIGIGNLPGNNVYSIAEDLEGEIWVGTDKGIAVFYTPENTFSSSGFDAQQILVEFDGHVQNLLESETVTAIAVDGSNKKWMGTEKAGVFLLSPDGTEQILHFTAEDSPLLSNNIICIAIDHVSGEVFFGTDKGIISYRGFATKGGEEFGDVYAFPNPVRENYNGYIAIKGLVTDANVKITDISGNLICETIAEGGQAIWNGRNFSGERAKTGVYLVFCSNSDGSQTLVTKILVVN